MPRVPFGYNFTDVCGKSWKKRKWRTSLKKSGGILCEGNRLEVYRFIDQHRDEFGTRWLFRRLDICPNAYYNYKKQRKSAYSAHKQEVKDKIQMPAVTPHVCRHTYCTRMAKSGITVKTLQYLMGHTDVSVTLGIYTHSDLEDAQEELNRLKKNTAGNG